VFDELSCFESTQITMPFLSEALYQNLVCSIFPEAPESLHLADWPTFDPARLDAALNQ